MERYEKQMWQPTKWHLLLMQLFVFRSTQRKITCVITIKGEDRMSISDINATLRSTQKVKNPTAFKESLVF